MAIVGKWKLNEASGVDRVDLSGNNNTLTDVGGVPTATGHGGGANLAASFTLNENKYLQITDAAQTGLDLGSTFSISLWTKLNQVGIFQSVIGKWDATGNQRSFTFESFNNLLFYYSIDGINSLSLTSSPFTLSSSIWYNFQVVADGTNIKLYIGVKGGSLIERASNSFSGTLYNSTSPFLVGKRSDGGICDSVVDDIVIASHAFTSEERAAYFSAGDDLVDGITTQTIIDGKDYAVIKLTNFSTGTGESAVIKVDVSALNPATTNVTIEEIIYNITGMVVSLFWDANTDIKILDLSSFGCMNFEEFGGLINNSGAGVTGDILLTTTGHNIGDTYDIILKLRKL